jgi:adenosylcobinamide-phosphate synthase
MEINHFLLLPCVVLLDAIAGEPTRYHPLIGFGDIATFIENRFNNNRILSGVIAWLLLVLPLVFFTWILTHVFGEWFELIIGYLALGATSLWQHAKPIQLALESKDLALARQRLSWIVSRNTATLNEEDISKATIESLLENGSDAIFATLFWFAVAGAEGALLYRLSNTLDAMWGYKNKRYHYFGRFAARVDDVLNWIPARLTAIGYSLYGDTKTAWQCWQQQGNQWYSPNAGPVMAAGAGSLGLKLGGDALYDGKLKARITLGRGRTAEAKDITRAWRMVRTNLIFWCIIALILGLCVDSKFCIMV